MTLKIENERQLSTSIFFQSKETWFVKKAFILLSVKSEDGSMVKAGRDTIFFC